MVYALVASDAPSEPPPTAASKAAAAAVVSRFLEADGISALLRVRLAPQQTTYQTAETCSSQTTFVRQTPYQLDADVCARCSYLLSHGPLEQLEMCSQMSLSPFADLLIQFPSEQRPALHTKATFLDPFLSWILSVLQPHCRYVKGVTAAHQPWLQPHTRCSSLCTSSQTGLCNLFLQVSVTL